MALLLLLIQITPADLATQGDYQAAITAYEKELKTASKEDSFDILVDIGDLYLYFLYQPEPAQRYYLTARKKFPEEKRIGSLLYRLGHASELQEDYQNAAKYFSEVVTKHRDCPYVNDALSAVERSFRKNYQDLVARVDGWPITRIEIDEIIQNMPTVMRPGYESVEKQKELIDRQVIERLITKFALDHSYDTISTVKRQYTYANKRYLMDQLLMKDIYSKIKVTEDDIKDYYNKNLDKFTINRRIKIREIVTESESLANWLRDSIIADSTAWDTLAKQYSVAPSKHSGGNVGYLVDGIKPPEIDSVLFSTELGEITPVVMPDSNQYAFYKIVEYRKRKQRDVNEVKSMIRSTIEAEERKKLQKELEDSLLSKIKHEYFLEKEHGDTLAIFDHHHITQADLDYKMEQLPPFAKLDFQGEEGRERLLKEMVKEELRYISAFKKKYYLGDTTFIQSVNSRRNAMLAELWQREILDKAQTTEEEIKEYYNAHIDSLYTVPAQVRLRGLLTKDRAIADSIYSGLRYKPWYWPFSYRYRTGTFDSLVNHFSLNPDTVRGADFGYVIKGSNPLVDSLVFPKKPNTIVEPIYDTRDSTYYIYWLVEKNPVRIVPYENAKVEIERNMKRKKIGERREAFLKELKENVKVEYFLPEEPKEVGGKEEKKKK